MPLWRSLEAGNKRAVAVWHRRAGKDAVGVNWTVTAAMQRVGIYWHMLPTLLQGRKVVWDGITKDGRKVLDAWPEEIITKRRNDEMKLDLVNGSMWQVVGSDNYNSLVGSNPIGVVFSEYSLADPAAWDFIRPILAENDGWALFLYTPRGRNHGHVLYQMAKSTPGWFASLLGADQTGAISDEVIEAERLAGMSEEMVQQEFFCSFEAPLFGAYYAKEMLEVEREERICSVPYDKAVPVETWWDLGIGDATAIWFAQRVGREIHLIDYYESSGEALSHYVRVLNDKPYTYAEDVVPHDAEARELISGKTRIEVMRSLNRRPAVVTRHAVDDRINAVRMNLNRCWFDAKKTERGVECLRQYRKEYDEKHKSYRTKPVHDWASHGADAFGVGIMHSPRDTKAWGKKLDYDLRWVV